MDTDHIVRATVKALLSAAWSKIFRKPDIQLYFDILFKTNLFSPNQSRLKPDEFCISELVSVFLDICQSSEVEQNQLQEVFCKKDVLKNLAKFTGKQLWQSLFFNKIAGLTPTTLLKKRLWHKFFFLWILINYRAPPCECFWW